MPVRIWINYIMSRLYFIDLFICGSLSSSFTLHVICMEMYVCACIHVSANGCTCIIQFISLKVFESILARIPVDLY